MQGNDDQIHQVQPGVTAPVQPTQQAPDNGQAQSVQPQPQPQPQSQSVQSQPSQVPQVQPEPQPPLPVSPVGSIQKEAGPFFSSDTLGTTETQICPSEPEPNISQELREIGVEAVSEKHPSVSTTQPAVQ